MFLAPCQHKYGERAGESESKVPEKLCKSRYHSSPEKPQRTVVSFSVGGAQTAAHDATCRWLLVLQPFTFMLLQGEINNPVSQINEIFKHKENSNIVRVLSNVAWVK